jgi:hypothetical protein
MSPDEEMFVPPSEFPATRIPQIGPLPRWKCHKEVRAFKIAKVWMGESTGIWYLFSSESGVGPIVVPNEYIERYKPEQGGYYVRYADGYESFSPTKAFEEGYTRLTESQKEPAPENYY